jgi:hypothetical protein
MCSPTLLTVFSTAVGALTIRSNAEREAFEHDTAAYNFGSQSRAATATARNARTAGWLNAATTVLGGAGTLVDRRARAAGLGLNSTSRQQARPQNSLTWT